MTPLELQVQELTRQVETLTGFMRSFENAGQLDSQTVRSLSQLLSTASSKGATSENVSINEAGAATKNALGIPDGFIRIGSVNVPYYN